MRSALWRHYWATIKHKAQILWITIQTCVALLRRAFVHDNSKFGKTEAEAFAALEGEFADVVFGSPQYYDRLQILRGALSHHYRVNRHHPEHFQKGFVDMGFLDVVEMLIDWRASSKRNAGSLEESLLACQSRFGFDDKTLRKMVAFYIEISNGR